MKVDDCLCLRPQQGQLEGSLVAPFNAASGELFEHSGKRSERRPRVWGNARHFWGRDPRSRLE